MFNGSSYLLDRHLAAGDGARLALTGPLGDYTFAQLHDRVRRTASGLRDIGLQPEQRVVLFMADGPDFVTIYLAAMRIGAVPVPVSTMLHADGLAELLRDSRARLLAITREFVAIAAEAAADAPELVGLIGPFGTEHLPVHGLDALSAATAMPSTIKIAEGKREIIGT